MNSVYRILCALFLCSAVSPRLTAVDTAITSYQEELVATTTAVTAVASLFATPRVSAATTLKNNISDQLDAIAVTSTDVSATNDQLTTLSELTDSFTALKNRCSDHIFIGTLHAQVATQITALAFIHVDQNIDNIATTISNARDALTTIKTTYLNTFNLGVGHSEGIITNAAWAEFNADRTRADNAYAIANSLALFSTDYASLSAAQESVPAPSDDTIVDYDTSFLAAQEAIETAAQTNAANITAIVSLLPGLASSQELQSNQVDYIADAAQALETTLSQFSRNNSAILARIGLARQEVALRVLQRQLLFDATTAAAKTTIKNSIVLAMATYATANATFQSAVSQTTALLTVPATVFSSTPPAPAPEGQRSNMGVIVDTKVAQYFDTLRTTLRKLFPTPPSEDTINAIVATLNPAVYIQMTGNAMSDWLIDRITLLAPLVDTAFTDLLADCTEEWNELVAIIDAVAVDPIISDAARTAIASAKAVTEFSELCTDNTTANLFVAKATTINKRPLGSVRRLSAIGSSEFQRLILSLIGQIQSGSVTQPVTTFTNAASSAPNVKTVPNNPSETIDSTSTLTSTLADGDEILITGTGNLAARLRDPVFSQSVSNKLSASLKIFLNKSARIGLGTANISNTPGQTVNVLGGSDANSPESIQIVPDGNCFVDVNSDLLISGSKPIVPTATFGTDMHTITFYSEVARTITITANTTWDLTDFGSTGNDYAEYGKQIVFGGKVRLVLEPGAKIRFPHVDPAEIKKTVVLYFNDDSQLVCQGDPLLVGKPWKDLLIAGSDCKRNKFMGMGEVWLNKNALMIINKPALLGIEADYKTPKTDITFSLQRNAQLLIGTKDVAGGAFQVGNMFNGGSKENPHSGNPDTNFPNSSLNPDPDFVPHQATIDFTLTLNGNEPRFVIGRQGFFGLAAGVINKDGAPNTSNGGPNGVTGIANSAWQLQHLYNVSNITLDITQGIFDHSIVAAGNAPACSLMALSKLSNSFPYSKYIIKLGGNAQSLIRGGGMLYFIDTNASMILDDSGSVTPSPHTVLINDAVYDISFTLPNSGKQAPLAPSFAIKTRKDSLPGITDYAVYGRGIVKSSIDLPYVFAGPAEEFFYALRLNTYNTTTNRFCPLVWIDNAPTAVYVGNNTLTGSTISRAVIKSTDLIDGLVEDAISFYGYVRGNNKSSGRPTKFSMPVQ